MRIWVGLLTVALLTGCSGRPASPPTPAAPGPPLRATTDSMLPDPVVGPPSGLASAPDPRPVAAADPCAGPEGSPLQIQGSRPPRFISGPGACRFAVSTGQFMVHATVHTETEDAAVRAVRISGAEPLWPATTRRDPEHPDVWSVIINLGDGKVGETIDVTLMPDSGELPLTATLTRTTPPTVTILLQGAGGTWAPIESGISLLPGPKRLRFQTTGGLTVDALTPYYLTSAYARLSPDRVTRIAGDLLEVEFTNPPPLVQTYVSGGANADGLSAPLVSGHFYIGDPPALVAVNPARAAVERIGPAPAGVNGNPVLREDGRYLALTTLVPESTSGQLVWLVDLKSGALTRTPFQYEDGAGAGFDARGRLIAPAGPGRLGVMDPETGKADIVKTTATFWSRVSPDGRYIAGRVGPPPGRSTGAWVGPPRSYQLVVRDLLDDFEQVFPWAGYGGLDWLPDGRLLMGTVSTDEYPGNNPPPEKLLQFFTVDLTTGQRTPYAGAWPERLRPTYEGSWSPGEMPLANLPDGRVLLYRWPNLPNARLGMI